MQIRIMLPKVERLTAAFALISTVSFVFAGKESQIGKDCDIPDIHDGRLRLLDTWPDGFAVMVDLNLAPQPPPNSLSIGWSIVIVFDKPIGKNPTVTSWSMELSSISEDGKTFTFRNLKHTKVIKSTRFGALLIVDDVVSATPQKAYVGFYGHHVQDASCVPPLEMTEIASSEVISAPITTDPTKPPEHNSSEKTTKAILQTQKTMKTTMMTTIVASSPTTRIVASSPTTMLSPGATFCVVEKKEGYYTADDSWEDSGNHHFSGNIILSPPRKLDDWWMVAVFEDQITKIETWAIRIIDHTENGLVWTFGPLPWSPGLDVGETDVRFIATQGYATTSSPNAHIYICSDSFTSGDAVMTRPNTNDSLLQIESLETSPTTDSPLMTLRPMATSPETRPTTVPSTQRCLPNSKRGSPVERAGQTQLNFTPDNNETRHNFNKLLHMSILFYEAQRSGYLPQSNRIPWRGDSGLKDGCDIGVDVTGGWYDAGDGVKFNFPMAFSLTTLAWGGIEFRQAYEAAGELENMISLIKWPTEYFIKTHISKYELVGQVGHGQTDHNYWGRHEQMTMRRPTYTITAKRPGTELAAEVAAALAASSIFLRSTDPELSESALNHAKEIFEFADKYRGLYHKSIPDVVRYYKSWSGYRDELVWSATWLYKATKDPSYLRKAMEFYSNMNGKHTIAKEFSWDQKLPGAQALLAEITGKEDFRKPFERYLDNLQTTRKTPQGMYYLHDWGSNRYAANAAFMSIIGARLKPFHPKRVKYIRWARRQIGLLLGDAGRSFVVGYGVNPPRRAHHASSSCPPYPERCDWSTYHSPKPNHYVLYGALVGGPNLKGVYGDNRALFQETEVACDYNAGYQSALAGIKQFVVESRAATEAAKKTTAKTTTVATTKETTKATTTTQTTTDEATQSGGAADKPTSAAPSAAKRKRKKGPCRPKKSQRCIRAAKLAKKRGKS